MDEEIAKFHETMAKAIKEFGDDVENELATLIPKGLEDRVKKICFEDRPGFTEYRFDDISVFYTELFIPEGVVKFKIGRYING